MSSRIVINSWGSYGDVYPYIPLGEGTLSIRGSLPSRSALSSPDWV